MLTKKRILPIFISFLMAFAMMPLTAGKAHATGYNIEVGGVPVTDANAGDILGNGTARYNPDTGTLTLNGATISKSILASTNIPVKIELIGENKVSGSSAGIQFGAWGGTITGPGSLIVEGSNHGIFSNGDITIDGTTVSATGYTNSCIGSDSDITITNSTVTVTSENNTAGIRSGGDITISGSTVTASPEGFDYGIQSGGEIKIDGSSKVQAEGEYSALYCSGGITIGDGLAITEPANGTVYDGGNLYYIKYNNGIAKSVTIEPLVKYQLWVGSKQVTNANAGDIPGVNSGKASYDAKSNTLTLDGVTIRGSHMVGRDYYNIYSTSDINIVLIGENLIIGAVRLNSESNCIWANNITITGDGSLQTGEADNGIFSNGSITISNSTVTATGRTYGISSREKLKIEGSSKVHAKGSYDAIYCINGITIGDGLGITEPENGRVADSGHFIVDQNGNNAKSATIEPVYTLTLAKTTNGKASLSAEKAGEGAKVTVTATPDKGYVLDKMTYTDKDGKTTAIPSSGEITMPASDITVNVTFKKQNVKPEPTKPTTKPAPKPAPVAKVSGTLLAKMTAKGKKNLVLSWNKVSGAQGYDVFFVKCNHNNPCKLVTTIEGNKTFKWTKKKLKKKTAYKAYVRAWVMKDGKKSYVKTSPTVHAYTSGSTKHYTNAKKVTVKNSEVSLIKGNTYQIKAKVKKLKKGKKLMKKGHGPKLRYLSSNTKVAAVSSSGKILAKAKGKCSVYVYAVNGVSKTIKVTVK